MKATTQPLPTKEDALKAKNDVVKNVYFAILLELKELIKFLPTEYLRTYIEVDYSSIGLDSKHGFYSPLSHLQLEEKEGLYIISFARNYFFKQQLGNYLDSLMTRCVYKHTSQETTDIPIEDSLEIKIYNKDDFRNAKSLLDKGFKDGKKTTVELIIMKTTLNEIINPQPEVKQILFPVNHHPFIDTAHKNAEILRVFSGLIVDLRFILSKMNATEYRTYLLKQYPKTNALDEVLYEFTCVICELRLYKKDYCYRIEYETDGDITKVIGGYYRDALRAAYRATMYENTSHNLEDCITIHTNMVDHYSYFKNKLKETESPYCLKDVENPSRDWEQI
jgi:hypothetical protein